MQGRGVPWRGVWKPSAWGSGTQGEDRVCPHFCFRLQMDCDCGSLSPWSAGFRGPKSSWFGLAQPLCLQNHHGWVWAKLIPESSCGSGDGVYLLTQSSGRESLGMKDKPGLESRDLPKSWITVEAQGSDSRMLGPWTDHWSWGLRFYNKDSHLDNFQRCLRLLWIRGFKWFIHKQSKLPLSFVNWLMEFSSPHIYVLTLCQI